MPIVTWFIVYGNFGETAAWIATALIVYGEYSMIKEYKKRSISLTQLPVVGILVHDSHVYFASRT